MWKFWKCENEKLNLKWLILSFSSFFRKVFAYLQENHSVNPGTITSDFEESLRLAAKDTWPEASTKGCWFHYGQALRRKSKSLPRLASKLKTSNEAGRIVMLYNRLALLPCENIQEGLEFIVEETQTVHLATIFIWYGYNFLKIKKIYKTFHFLSRVFKSSTNTFSTIGWRKSRLLNFQYMDLKTEQTIM